MFFVKLNKNDCNNNFNVNWKLNRRKLMIRALYTSFTRMREKPGLLDNTEENSEMRANTASVCMTVRVRSTFPI